jgi:hypothetical protein
VTIASRIQKKLDMTNDEFKKSIEHIENQQKKSKLKMSKATSRAEVSKQVVDDDDSVTLDADGTLTPYKLPNQVISGIVSPNMKASLDDPLNKGVQAIYSTSFQADSPSPASKVTVSAKYQRKQILLEKH